MPRRTIDQLDHMPLPQLCTTSGAFAVVVSAELIAIAISAVRSGLHPDPWIDFAFCSVYAQIVMMSCALVMCRLQKRLVGAQVRTIIIALFIAAMVVALLASEFCWRIIELIGPDRIADKPSHQAFQFRTATITLIVASSALRYGYVAQQWRRQIEAKQAARNQALQAMIRPHFLFNSLNTIAELTRSDPIAAERAVEDLADLFRASLSDADSMSTLQEEIEMTQRYQLIEQYRLGDRLDVTWDIDELPEDIAIPHLSLQPLFENAVYHGIQPIPEGGSIRVTGRLRGDHVRITIANPKPPPARNGQHDGNKIAQDNLRERIELAYGGQGRFEVEEDAQTYRVLLSIPIRAEETT